MESESRAATKDDDRIYLRKKEEQLRKKKEQLRKKKERLRKEKEQLRERENLLLRSTLAAGEFNWIGQF